MLWDQWIEQPSPLISNRLKEDLNILGNILAKLDEKMDTTVCTVNMKLPQVAGYLNGVTARLALSKGNKSAYMHL